MNIKYLEDDKMMMSAGNGEVLVSILIFQTGEEVPMPDRAENSVMKGLSNMDPYTAASGHLTAGDGFRAPGTQLVAIA